MPRIDLDGWVQDKARREVRIKNRACPMCGKPRRTYDLFCSDDCQFAESRGEASLELAGGSK